jgi:hypothetical protein
MVFAGNERGGILKLDSRRKDVACQGSSKQNSLEHAEIPSLTLSRVCMLAAITYAL